MNDIGKRLRDRILDCPIGSSDALLLGDAYTEIERLRRSRHSLQKDEGE